MLRIALERDLPVHRIIPLGSRFSLVNASLTRWACFRLDCQFFALAKLHLVMVLWQSIEQSLGSSNSGFLPMPRTPASGNEDDTIPNFKTQRIMAQSIDQNLGDKPASGPSDRFHESAYK
jgi:hypothetical protein